MPDKTAPQIVVRVLSVWAQIEKWIAVAAFTLIGVLVFADVFGREFIGPILGALGFDTGPMGVFGSRKMATYLLVIGAFAGLGVSVATGSQIVPRVAFAWVPADWNDTMNRIGNLFSGLFLLVVTYYAMVFVLSSREIGTVMPGMDWPAWVIQTAIPAGFASASLRYLAFALFPAIAPEIEEFQE